MTDLVTIKTKGGASFTVAKSNAPKFEGLLNDLEAAGYPINPQQSGGYNYRTIAGSTKLSNHATGSAVDVNWTDNPRGGMGKIPADTARALAAKYGLTWGGDWKNPDPMHFEAAGGPVPLQNRGITTVAGLSPASAPSGAPASNAAPESTAGLPGIDGDLPAGTAGQPQFGSMRPQQPSESDQLAEMAMQEAMQAAPQMQLTGRRMAQAPDINRIRQAVRGRLGITGA